MQIPSDPPTPPPAILFFILPLPNITVMVDRALTNNYQSLFYLSLFCHTLHSHFPACFRWLDLPISVPSFAGMFPEITLFLLPASSFSGTCNCTIHGSCFPVPTSTFSTLLQTVLFPCTCSFPTLLQTEFYSLYIHLPYLAPDRILFPLYILIPYLAPDIILFPMYGLHPHSLLPSTQLYSPVHLHSLPCSRQNYIPLSHLQHVRGGISIPPHIFIP